MGKNLYFHFYLFFILFFSIEFFEGVSRGGPYRWSMDRSVRWSVDLVRWTGPRTGGQCFRVTRKLLPLRIIQVGYTVSANNIITCKRCPKSLGFKIKDRIYRKSSFSGTERAFSTITNHCHSSLF